MICKSIAYELMNLHRMHIVHADIKEDNILIKVSSVEGTMIGKIIDLDASFFEFDPPKYEDDLVCDQVYMAPEACQFICGEPVELTCKMDVFSLGILFHQYLTGVLPGYDFNEYDYAYESVLDDQPLTVDTNLPSKLQEMLQGMLECDPEKRLSMDSVYSTLCDYTGGKNVDPELDYSSGEDCDIEDDIDEASDKWFFSAGDL